MTDDDLKSNKSQYKKIMMHQDMCKYTTFSQNFVMNQMEEPYKKDLM